MKIELKYKYLKHDIDQRTFRAVEAKMEAGEMKDALQLDDDDSNSSYVLRGIEAALARLKVVLRKRLKESTLTLSGTKDDSISISGLSTKTWTLELEDDDRILADLQSLTELCHEFVVAWVCLQWANDMMPDMAGVLTQQVESALAAVEDAAFRKGAPRKRLPIGDPVGLNSIEFES